MSQYRFTKDFGGVKAGNLANVGETVTVSIFELIREGILEEVKEEEWPRVGDTVWRFNRHGEVYSFRHEHSKCTFDGSYLLGIYRTKEEAEKARDDVREFIRNRNKSND